MMQMANRIRQRGRLRRGDLFADAAEAVEPRRAQFVRTRRLGRGRDDHHLFRSGGRGFFEQSADACRPIGQAMRFAAPVGIRRKPHQPWIR